MPRRVLLALVLLWASTALADEQLVLKDGRTLTVTRLARRNGKVRFETKDGKVYEVPEDQVVSPSLDSISGGAPVEAAAAPAAEGPQVLELKDGRKIIVTRLARRNGKVRIETKDGKVFEVPEDQVVSPPLSSIPSTAPSAPQPLSGVLETPQVVELKDGRKITVTRLARRGGLVLFETTTGERFSVSESQIVSPPLASIASVERPAPGPAPKPAPPVPAPAIPAIPAAPTVAVAAEAPTPPKTIAPQPREGTALSEAEFIPLPDRWGILDKLPDDPRLVRGRTIDPYNQNILKADKPIIGDSTFLVVTGVLDAPFERRRLPAIGGVSTETPGEFEFFGAGDQTFTSPEALVSLELFSGQTAFKPKSWALKVEGAFDLNYLDVVERNAVTADVRSGLTRLRHMAALQEAFGEVKLATVSHNYDFVSLRAGIQPFNSDFRGLVFSDDNLGARLFGNADNNRWQYNAAYFDLLEKDTNSELNTFDKREQKVGIANVFRQDFLVPGYTFEASFHSSVDNANFHYDTNGILTRPAPIGLPIPHEVDSRYIGIAGDGHFGRLNLDDAFYYAFGTDNLNPIAGHSVDIQAFLGAVEASFDRDWVRFKLSGFWASGDSNPLQGKATGFDSIVDSSNFAGGPFSFWSRSTIALTQTKVLLKPSDTLLPDLRSNKFEGQANFVNPGLRLVGLNMDVNVSPKVRAILNANYLWFDQTAVLEAVLFQSGIQNAIGLDWGAGVIYRPLLNQNIVITAGVTGLQAGPGFVSIYSSAPCGVAGCGFPSRTLLNGFVDVKLTY
jgi:hypothetical protein